MRLGSSPQPAPGQRAGITRLQRRDFGFQELAFEQHLAQAGLQPIALQHLAVKGPGGQARLAGGKKGLAPARERRRRHPQRARYQLQVLAPKQAQYRVALALSRHPPAPAEADRIPLRYRLCRHAHYPCPRIPSAYGVSQATVERGTRKVVGWAMREHMRAEFTMAALTMAIQRRR